MTEFCDILKLAELLNPKKSDNSDDEEDEFDRPIVKDLALNDINRKPGNPIIKEEGIHENKLKEDKRNVEEVDPAEEALRLLENENRDINDWRKSPQWDVVYRQQVTPNDVFLQMGGKTPATSSCENMIITVHLPGENRQNIDLKVTADKMDLVSPRYRLSIPLPHPVDPQKGNAQFDSEAEKLIITLQMNREFDYINF